MESASREYLSFSFSEKGASRGNACLVCVQVSESLLCKVEGRVQGNVREADGQGAHHGANTQHELQATRTRIAELVGTREFMQLGNFDFAIRGSGSWKCLGRCYRMGGEIECRWGHVPAY